MSRKSRQRQGHKLLREALPTWLALLFLIAGLWMGILGVLSPSVRAPIPLEEATALSVTLQKVEGQYKKNRSGPFRLRGISILYADDGEMYLPDMPSLYIPSVLASQELLTKLQSYPAGTVIDALTEPNGRDVLALSADGEAILTYEEACQAIHRDNQLGIPLGIFFLGCAVYGGWSLIIRRQYRKLVSSNHP